MRDEYTYTSMPAINIYTVFKLDLDFQICGLGLGVLTTSLFTTITY